MPMAIIRHYGSLMDGLNLPLAANVNHIGVDSTRDFDINTNINAGKGIETTKRCRLNALRNLKGAIHVPVGTVSNLPG